MTALSPGTPVQVFSGAIMADKFDLYAKGEDGPPQEIVPANAMERLRHYRCPIVTETQYVIEVWYIEFRNEFR